MSGEEGEKGDSSDEELEHRAKVLRLDGNSRSLKVVKPDARVNVK